MDWHYLGHAGWLVECGDQRLLFDPLLQNLHHGDVFELDPSREIDIDALQPDFLVVSHRHPDHFDLPSLHALAKRDPETVVFTADPLVARTARALGFVTVAEVETYSRIDLDGIRLVTTPSHHEDEIEWGMMLESNEGVVWNQIDSYHPDPSQILETLEKVTEILSRDVQRQLPLALVRWQPVLETHIAMGERAGFPIEEYEKALARIANIHARAVVPSAAGVYQAGPYGYMNQFVYPVPLRRAMRDLRLRCPDTAVLPSEIGATYRVRDGVTAFDPHGAQRYVKVTRPYRPADTMFRPYEFPALRDPNLDARDENAMRSVAERWIMTSLASGLVKEHPSMGVARPLRFAVEVVFPKTTDVYTIEFDASASSVSRTMDDDYDALNAIAGSLLVDVIEGRRQWGDPLLGGMLRSSMRLYSVDANGLEEGTSSATFLYYGLPYNESVERATVYQLHQLLGTASSSGVKV